MTLYVVATPIGNLSDLTPRMRETVASCALIAAEDTRVTRNLLSHWGLRVPMLSLNRHNEGARVSGIIGRMLDEGIDVAVMTDAGTPCVSDPGYMLVAAAHEAGITVSPVAGPSALTAALSASGFDARSFAYYGFLPRAAGPLNKALTDIWRAGVPVAVLNEAPRRVIGLLGAVDTAIPGCRCAVHCDLTKRFERIDRGAVSDVAARLAGNPNHEKGEYTVVLEMPPFEEKPEAAEAEGPEYALLRVLLDGEDMAGARARVLSEGAYSRNEVYAAALRLGKVLRR